MRLGRERPRKDAQEKTNRNGDRASMRLGRERPRKRGRPGRRQAAVCRFNEAGARTPQKVPLRAPAPGSSRSASMRLGRERPRKAVDCLDAGVRQLQASMRLGRERPRKRADRGRGRRNRRRFNEAGARTPQKDEGGGGVRPGRDCASMRLGRERPRNPRLHADSHNQLPASMRLGRERPRNGQLQAGRLFDTPLQ